MPLRFEPGRRPCGDFLRDVEPGWVDQHLGPRGLDRPADDAGAVGPRPPGEPRLVRRWRAGERLPHSVPRQLQLREDRLVPDQRADHHGQMAGLLRPEPPLVDPSVHPSGATIEAPSPSSGAPLQIASHDVSFTDRVLATFRRPARCAPSIGLQDCTPPVLGSAGHYWVYSTCACSIRPLNWNGAWS